VVSTLDRSRSFDTLEAEGLDHIAKGFTLLATAARQRAERPVNVVGPEWIDPKASPLGKRRTLALARAGVVESTKIGRKVLVGRASLDRYLDEHRRGVPAASEDLFGAAS
jgi:hypothetical protein